MKLKKFELKNLIPNEMEVFIIYSIVYYTIYVNTIIETGVVKNNVVFLLAQSNII